MSVKKLWSRVAVSVVAIGIIVVVTAFSAWLNGFWLQERKATKQQLNANAVQKRVSMDSPYQLPQNSLADQTPGRSVSMATTVRYTLPIEQQRLVAFLRSQPKEGNAEKKADARSKLIHMVEVELADRFANQAAELEQLEKRVVDAKSKLAQRHSRKREIIDRRISELLNEPDELAWNANTDVNQTKDLSVPNSAFINNSGFYNTAPVAGSNSGPGNYPQYMGNVLPYNSSPSPNYLPSNGWNPPVNSNSQNGAIPILGGSERIESSNAPAASIPPTASISSPTFGEANLQVADSFPTTSVPNLESKNVKARFGNELESLSNEAIEVESDLEELEGLTASGKAETIQRLALRKRIKQLELRLDEASKDIKRQQQSHQSALELAKKELNYFEGALKDAKRLLSEGAISKSEVEAKMLDMERAKFKVESLRDEQVAPLERLSSISDRVNLIRKKLDESLQPKALPVTRS